MYYLGTSHDFWRWPIRNVRADLCSVGLQPYVMSLWCVETFAQFFHTIQLFCTNTPSDRGLKSDRELHYALNSNSPALSDTSLWWIVSLVVSSRCKFCSLAVSGNRSKLQLLLVVGAKRLILLDGGSNFLYLCTCKLLSIAQYSLAILIGHRGNINTKGTWFRAMDYSACPAFFGTSQPVGMFFYKPERDVKKGGPQSKRITKLQIWQNEMWSDWG